MRIDGAGKVLRPVQIELPAELHRRLEREKTRRGASFNSLILEWIRPHLEAFKPDFVLFSYHGVPERQVQKSDPTGQHCLRKADCCAGIEHANRYCYRAQCYASTRALVAALAHFDVTRDPRFVALTALLAEG